MKAFAIVHGPNNNGVTIRTSNGNTALAIFHEYKEAVRVLAGFIEEGGADMKIIDVEITLA